MTWGVPRAERPTLGRVSVEGHSPRALEEAFASERPGGRPAERVSVVRVREGSAARRSDHVAAEDPLEIRLAGEPVAVTMRTPAPGEDIELAIGFLTGEAIVSPDDIERVVECRSEPGEGSAVDVRPRPGVSPSGGWQRSFYATSSCGICGKASIDAVRVAAAPIPPGPRVDAAVLLKLPARLRAAQRVFDRTGGLHAAGLFDSDGELLVVREDVGRHNAVDKAIGWAATNGRLPANDLILQVSGRASFEIVQKAAVAGIPVVAAVSAPSSLAVQLAAEAGITLVGFLRSSGFNLYAAPERVSELGRV
jgi:FdhD protein